MTQAGFSFGTKASTLAALKDVLRFGRVCDCCIFTVQEWLAGRAAVLVRVAQTFPGRRVIVRSSALNEDGDAHTMAGAYTSVMNVMADEPLAVADAVESVVASYGDRHPEGNEVLVQPMIDHVSMSGVVFSHDLNTGAPYYVVNYDDVSGKTDTVTSGSTDTSRTLLIHRDHVDEVQSPRFRALLRAVREIEGLVQSPGIDLEFAMTRDDLPFIFQVRRMAVRQNWNRDISRLIGCSLDEIARFLGTRFRRRHGVAGPCSLFGEMPDWNPAEMIGTVPRPLARSLYERLITNSVWAEARAEMGYRDLTGRPLMASLGGRVFIDVRESLNSFLPAEVPEPLAEALVTAWIDRLRENPELHDKIEFEVAVTVYTLDFEERIQPVAHALGGEDRETLGRALLNLTNRAVSEAVGDDTQAARLAALDQRRRAILACRGQDAPLELVRALLDDCANLGTRSFSIIARRAFMAESLLRSLVVRGILAENRAADFRASVVTVLTEFLARLYACSLGGNDWARFMDDYGHLRPGTYDILASRYDQHEELAGSGPGGGTDGVHHVAFDLSDDEARAIDTALHAAGFAFDAATLFTFMREAVAGREQAKLVFTRNVSDALELMADWGVAIGLSRDELSFLGVEQILDSVDHTFHCGLESHYRELAKRARADYEVSQALRLPYLIGSLSDIYVVPLLKSRPNFITAKRVQAPLHYLSDHDLRASRGAGRVILIERADPGYDWIFLMPIAGLVTQYGGSNSHMAIRCAELGVPAAIGCGEQVFEQLRKSDSVLLDCAAGMLVPIG